MNNNQVLSSAWPCGTPCGTFDEWYNYCCHRTDVFLQEITNHCDAIISHVDSSGYQPSFAQSCDRSCSFNDFDADEIVISVDTGKTLDKARRLYSSTTRELCSLQQHQERDIIFSSVFRGRVESSLESDSALVPAFSADHVGSFDIGPSLSDSMRCEMREAATEFFEQAQRTSERRHSQLAPIVHTQNIQEQRRGECIPPVACCDDEPGEYNNEVVASSDDMNYRVTVSPEDNHVTVCSTFDDNVILIEEYKGGISCNIEAMERDFRKMPVQDKRDLMALYKNCRHKIDLIDRRIVNYCMTALCAQDGEVNFIGSCIVHYFHIITRLYYSWADRCVGIQPRSQHMEIGRKQREDLHQWVTSVYTTSLYVMVILRRFIWPELRKSLNMKAEEMFEAGVSLLNRLGFEKEFVAIWSSPKVLSKSDVVDAVADHEGVGGASRFESKEDFLFNSIQFIIQHMKSVEMMYTNCINVCLKNKQLMMEEDLWKIKKWAHNIYSRIACSCERLKGKVSSDLFGFVRVRQEEILDEGNKLVTYLGFRKKFGCFARNDMESFSDLELSQEEAGNTIAGDAKLCSVFSKKDAERRVVQFRRHRECSEPSDRCDMKQQEIVGTTQQELTDKKTCGANEHSYLVSEKKEPQILIAKKESWELSQKKLLQHEGIMCEWNMQQSLLPCETQMRSIYSVMQLIMNWHRRILDIINAEKFLSSTEDLNENLCDMHASILSLLTTMQQNINKWHDDWNAAKKLENNVLEVEEQKLQVKSWVKNLRFMLLYLCRVYSHEGLFARVGQRVQMMQKKVKKMICNVNHSLCMLESKFLVSGVFPTIGSKHDNGCMGNQGIHRIRKS